MMTDYITDDLRQWAAAMRAVPHESAALAFERAADRIDSDAEALDLLRHELGEETAVVMEQRAEIERLTR